MRIYTDGSCIVNPGGPGGWAFVATDRPMITDQTVIRCGGTYFTSALTMEMMAILEALRWCEEQQKPIMSPKFYVDSHQALAYIEKLWKLGKVGWPGTDGWDNLNLMKQIFSLGMKLKPHFQYIQGHAGDPFNELANQTAQKMAYQFKEGQLVSYAEVEVGDSVAARAAGSIYTKVYKVAGKLTGSGNVLLKRAYSGATSDLIAIHEDEFNKTLFIKIIW